MYPDLSYILHDLFGTAPDNWTSIVKTFGLFLAFAFFSSAFFLTLELRRKEKEGLIKPLKVKTTKGAPASPLELAIQALFGFLIGFKVIYAILSFSEFKADAAGVILSGKGNWIGGLLGAVLFVGIRYWEREKNRLPEPKTVTTTVHPYERIGDITIMAAIFGVLGAKIFSILEDPTGFFDDPIGMMMSGSGMTIYGGLILAFIAVYWYVKKLGMKPIHVMDAVAPALIVGYGVGRIGCQLSGDGDWGITSSGPAPGWMSFLPDWMWSYDYPQNVLKQGVPIDNCTYDYCMRLTEGVYPTPFYETILAFIIAAILWSLRKRIKIPGILFFIYVTLNGIERFFIEKIRVNIKYDLGFMQPTQAEIISALLIVVGIVGIVYLYNRAKKTEVKTE